jgi:LysM repeat protein
MSIKRTIQLFVTAAVLFASFANGSAALAWSSCGSSYTVQSGDTLGTIANRCDTTVAALRLANPNLGYWIYAGQVLWMPGAFVDNGNGYAIYVVARGDTLKSIANRFGTTMSVLASLNGINNLNLIYVGQRLTVPNDSAVPAPAPNPYPQPGPATGGTYIVQWGDTMRKIAAKMNVNVNDLIAANPQIANPNVIYFGQVVYLPASPSNYTVQRGDTMRIIATRYGTTVDYLLGLNPQIWNANWIYAGEVIRVR